MNRLNHLPTLRVNPSEKISVHYRKKTFTGIGGDTVATALYANGVRIFSRSLKYHRPRGLYSLDGECSNTCMSVNGIPNVRTETTLLKADMRVDAQNVKGSADHDLMGFMDKLDWLMPAGFYYSMMHKPASIWPIAMKQIRKAAGLGTLSPDFKMTGVYDEIYPKTDICVVGGGPAGMMAAIAAADSGKRIILLEARPWLGGCFDYRPAVYGMDKPLYQRSRELADQVEKTPNIRVFKHTPLIGVYSNNLITAFQKGGGIDPFDERYVEIRAESVVVATGCIERPLMFDNNERPGVMQIGCAHRLARTYGLLPGKEAVFSVGHDLGLEAAIDLFDLGLQVACVADIREDGQDPKLLAGLAERRIPFLQGWVATKAHGAKQVNRVTIATLDAAKHSRIHCDLLVASAGLTPSTSPLSLAQATFAYDDHTGYFLPVNLPDKMYAAGRMLGFNSPLSIEASGRLAGLRAAIACGASCRNQIEETEKALAGLAKPERGAKLVMAPVKGRKTFICFDEDTTVKNIRQAIDMGFDVPELIKRFTSAGTGPGQGGIPGHNLPLYVAQYTASGPAHLQPTTVRPPLTPTYISTYAGSSHRMSKRTPVHDYQVKAGGIFRLIGVWDRARYFSEDFTCREEILNVRSNVGMLDASTLGKFRIHGPDALAALQRVYVSDIGKIREGRVKYSAMCNDDGCVLDDGVIVKIRENDYYLTTSTARAGQTIEWIRYHTRYDGWNFHMVNLTDSLGVINLSGPNARRVLEKITDADVSNTAFPFGGYREFTVGGAIPVRAMRLGFVGELSFELHVPASYMPSLWEFIESAGREFNIRNFGVEAQNVLRMEKGHIILGVESEQRTNLLDVGLGSLWNRSKTESKTVGAVALRQAEGDPGRLTLVGIQMEADRPPKDGSIIVDSRIRGYVCTARKSVSLDKAVGMALVESQLSDIGTRLEIFEDECNGKRIYARIISMPFYDPEGNRMKM
ncbi:MAG: 2Fe-2S iron-sulfur cluster-binding protein [Pseudomonadota bacterium]